jgi:hypothetical protein
VTNVGDSLCIILVKRIKTTTTTTNSREVEGKKKEDIVIIPMCRKITNRIYSLNVHVYRICWSDDPISDIVPVTPRWI